MLKKISENELLGSNGHEQDKACSFVTTNKGLLERRPNKTTLRQHRNPFRGNQDIVIIACKYFAATLLSQFESYTNSFVFAWKVILNIFEAEQSRVVQMKTDSSSLEIHLHWIQLLVSEHNVLWKACYILLNLNLRMFVVLQNICQQFITQYICLHYLSMSQAIVTFYFKAQRQKENANHLSKQQIMADFFNYQINFLIWFLIASLFHEQALLLIFLPLQRWRSWSALWLSVTYRSSFASSGSLKTFNRFCNPSYFCADCQLKNSDVVVVF